MRRHIERFHGTPVTVSPAAVDNQRLIGIAHAVPPLVQAFIFAQTCEQQMLPALLCVSVFHYLRHKLQQGTGVLPVFAVNADFVFLADADRKSVV